jgi:hypothetical protein
MLSWGILSPSLRENVLDISRKLSRKKTEKFCPSPILYHLHYIVFALKKLYIALQLPLLELKEATLRGGSKQSKVINKCSSAK